MARKNFSAKVKRISYLRSDGHCMICGRPVMSPNYAHIVPASPEGPRSENIKNYDTEFIVSADNCLCLCRDCHSIIDDDTVNKQSLNDLFEINKKYKQIYDLREEYKTSVGSYEKESVDELNKVYEKICDYLGADIKISETEDYYKIPYKDKMKRNNFNVRHKKEITNAYAEELSAFRRTISENPIVGIKLKSAVSVLYERLRKNEEDGDKVIDDMLRIMYDPSEGVVGNKIVLYYYFVICEVFQR